MNTDHRKTINNQLDCLLEYAKSGSASEHLMDVLKIQVSHVRDRVDEGFTDLESQRDYAVSTLDAWFDRRKLAQERIDDAVLDAVRRYLRTCRVGGMPTETSNAVEAVIVAMVDLGIFGDLFARYKDGE